MIPIPAVGLNVDMRNLRWSWPGYLTFGKSPKDEERKKGKKTTVDEQKSNSELGSKPVTGEETSLDALVAEGDTPCSDPLKEEGKVEVEVEVDTLSLADAMESENGHGGTSSTHSRTPSEAPPSPAARTIGPMSGDNAMPTAVRPPGPGAIFREGVDEMSHRPVSTGPLSPRSEEVPHPATSEPPPPPVTFSQTPVHLAPPGNPLRAIERRLYYLTVRHPSHTLFFKI